MNVLLIGSGGREHALAWAISASPLLTKLYCAPGNPGIAQVAELAAIDITNHAAVIEFCKDTRHQFCRRRAGSAAGGGAGRRSQRSGHQGLWPLKICRPIGRLQGFHQGHLRQLQYPDRCLRAFHGFGKGQGLSCQTRCSHCDQGRWFGGWQRCDRCHDSGGSRGRVA